MIMLPLGIAWLAAILVAPLDGRRPAIGWLAVGGLAASYAALLALAASVLRQGPRELVAGGWPAGLGITLRADALGMVFALVSVGVVLSALAYEVIAGVRARAFPALALFAAAGLNGLFLTGDAFNFYVFFEVSMTAAFGLASYGLRPSQTRAALIFTVVNLLGSVFFLAGVTALYHVTGTLDMRGIAGWAATVDQQPVALIATILFVAFSLKLGLFPFHFWLPPVYRDSSPAVAAILSGAVANIGSYGLLRFAGEMLPRERALGATLLLGLGAASIIYGAHQAVSVRTAREALAYSAISQAGYILVALGIGGPAGYAAAVLYTIVNGMNKAVLFLASGLRGWLVGAAFAVGALSVAGVPPSAGFFGKLALFHAGIAAEQAVLVGLLALGSALAFVYMFQIYQRDFWQRPVGGAPSSPAARGLVAGLAGLVLACGIWPEPILAASRLAAAALAGGAP